MIISQRDLVIAILKHLEEETSRYGLVPRQINAIISAADAIVDELAKPVVLATPGMGLPAWLACDDTGLSSRYMAHVLCGAPECANNHPHDMNDIGRCERFMAAVPGTRERLDMMRACSPDWAAVVECWPKVAP
jgi:hypothetical protein